MVDCHLSLEDCNNSKEKIVLKTYLFQFLSCPVSEEMDH